MNKTQFKQAIKNVQGLMGKNKYYTDNDLEIASIKAVEIINHINTNGGLLSNRLIKQGNMKLAKNCLVWDLPSIITCKYACKSCYALKSERIYKNTRLMRLTHLILLEYAFLNKCFYKNLLEYIKKELQEYFNKLVNSGKYKQLFLRLHSAGDIYSKYYLKFITDLLELIKDINIKVYTYTKQLGSNTIDLINRKYNNINIVNSLPCGRINYGTIDKMLQLRKDIKSLGCNACICPNTINKKVKCIKDCTICTKCQNVLFKIH